MLALETGIPIVPIAVRGSADVLPRRGWQVRAGDIDVVVGAPVPVAGVERRRADAAGPRAPRGDAPARGRARPAAACGSRRPDDRSRHAVPAGDPARRSRRDRPQPAGRSSTATPPSPSTAASCSPTSRCSASTSRSPTSPTSATLGDALPAHLPAPTATRTTSARCRTCSREFDVPVYGTPLTHRLRARAAARARAAGDAGGATSASRSASGRSTIEPFAITHSHPRRGRARHPHAGRHRRPHRRLQARPDAARRPAARPRPARRAGAEGVLLLLSDSTNVEHAGVTPSERTRRRAPRADLPRGDGTRPRHDVLVAHPPHAAGDRPRARASAARSALVGRSLDLARRDRRATSASCACRRRHARRPRRAPRDLPRERGDAASRRAARPRRPRRSSASRWTRTSRWSSTPGDTVVLSSRIIPGNERAISSLVNHLYRRGADGPLRTHARRSTSPGTHRRRS